jgi:hypothetical protein
MDLSSRRPFAASRFGGRKPPRCDPNSGAGPFGFSRDSATLYAIRRDSSRKWELAAFIVPDGRPKKIVPLDLPVSANIMGFSANPDNMGFITSVGQSRFDLWLLEGFAPSRRWLFH